MNPVRQPLSARICALQFTLFLVTTLLIRVSTLGHPDYFLDDAFYFASGIEVQQGAIPFVDVWDRKPYGNFLLFAAIAALSHDPATFQLAAMAFVATTALILSMITSARFGNVAGTAAGLLYILQLPLFGGDTVQTPLFYNALVAGAVLLLTRTAVHEDLARTARTTSASMLLLGLALTIKTSVIAEAIALGLFASWNWWRSARPSPIRMAGQAGKWALIGAAPSLAIAAGYWIVGYWDIYWHAMVVSNLSKAYDFQTAADRAHLMMRLIAPLAFLAVAGWIKWRKLPEAKLLGIWTLSALVGLLMLRNFYSHYALPILMPLAILSGAILSNWIAAALTSATALAIVFWLTPPTDFAQTRMAQYAFDRMAKSIRAHGGERGLFVYDGPVLLYDAILSRPPTPLFFPPHLNHDIERDVSHLSTRLEVKNVLASTPGTVVVATMPRQYPVNWETRRMVLRYVGDNCRKVDEVLMPMRDRLDRIAVWGDCRE